MKKIYLLLLFFISLFASAQKTLNEYKFVIVPIKYEFLNEENKYRLNTMTKHNLIKMGFEAFYENENLPVEANDRCSRLYVMVEKESAFLATKLTVIFKDCQNSVVYRSEPGKSKEKEFQKAYTESLNDAFRTLFNYGYAYNGSVNVSQNTTNVVSQAVKTTQNSVPISSPQIDETAEYLFAQPIKNGYQLVDKTPKVILKIYKTSQPDYFTAQSETINGAVIKKDGEWILEYYKDDKPVSEKLLIKF